MVFQCINIRQVPWKVLKTAASGLGFQHLPRDLANVNAWKTMFDPYIIDHINENQMPWWDCAILQTDLGLAVPIFSKDTFSFCVTHLQDGSGEAKKCLQTYAKRADSSCACAKYQAFALKIIHSVVSSDSFIEQGRPWSELMPSYHSL